MATLFLPKLKTRVSGALCKEMTLCGSLRKRENDTSTPPDWMCDFQADGTCSQSRSEAVTVCVSMETLKCLCVGNFE